jgi:cyclopropane-fatty-acyl-phospholipid synthase
MAGREDCRYGTGAPCAAIKILGSWTPWRIGLRPDLAFGEAYMDGRLTIEQGTMADVLAIILSNLGSRRLPRIMQLSRTMRRLLRTMSQFNTGRRSHRNVAHHYDLSKSLYALFLDHDLNYSCAYFRHPGMSWRQRRLPKRTISRPSSISTGRDCEFSTSDLAGAVWDSILPATATPTCWALRYPPSNWR